MFSDRLNAIMNIADVSNSLLSRSVYLSPSYIERLRSGTRTLPKKHEYLSSICTCLADSLENDYQINALNNLLQVNIDKETPVETVALYIEQWLLSTEQDLPASAFSPQITAPSSQTDSNITFVYGNKGKRRAVEMFFDRILKEEQPQTLLLFSDEDMSWLYEDSSFAMLWAETFKEVLAKGNRVKIIHTISRDINEMMEAIHKWLPIYATGMIEPYFYPRIRDGILRRTLFIAPDTAAVISSSIQNDTSGMLNQYITDSEAVNALHLEFERYFSLCMPLMKIFTERNANSYANAFEQIASKEGNAMIYCSNSDIATTEGIFTSMLLKDKGHLLSREDIPDGMLLYIKDGIGLVMIRQTIPQAAFIIDSPALVNTFWDYFKNR